VCGDLGIAVHRFDTLAAVIDAGTRITPDVIFVEPGMDGRDGEVLIPALAAHGFRCPVQLMSGLNPVLADEARKLGERKGLTMLPVLEKPFRVDVLTQRLDRLLEPARLAGEVARLRRENEALRDELEVPDGEPVLVGRSASQSSAWRMTGTIPASSPASAAGRRNGTSRPRERPASAISPSSVDRMTRSRRAAPSAACAV